MDEEDWLGDWRSATDQAECEFCCWPAETDDDGLMLLFDCCEISDDDEADCDGFEEMDGDEEGRADD